jgi:histidyl-tRNA synthetase
MRPELTPTLARVIAGHEREFKKLLKWFSIPQCFRYESSNAAGSATFSTELRHHR